MAKTKKITITAERARRTMCTGWYRLLAPHFPITLTTDHEQVATELARLGRFDASIHPAEMMTDWLRCECEVLRGGMRHGPRIALDLWSSWTESAASGAGSHEIADYVYPSQDNIGALVDPIVEIVKLAGG